jgi:drug/metabolite transporter (DMT)-like permease
MALIAAYLCTTFAAAKDLVSKHLASHLHGNVSTFASFLFALPFYIAVLAVLWFVGPSPFVLTGLFLQLVLYRAITDVFAEGMKMHALAHGDISLVASFMSLSPLFLVIVEPFTTGDKTGTYGKLAVALVVCGSLMLVYRPSSDGWVRQRKGVLLAIGASVFFTANSLLDAEASRTGAKSTSDFGAAVFSGFMVTVLSAGLILPLVWRRHHWTAMAGQQKGLWTRGLFEMLFMICKLYALQHMAPSKVASIMRLAMLLSIIGGRVYFKEEEFRRRLAAGILIVIGVVIITSLEEQESTFPE